MNDRLNVGLTRKPLFGSRSSRARFVAATWIVTAMVALMPIKSTAQLPEDSPRQNRFVKVVQQARPAVLPLFVQGDHPGSFGTGSGAIIHPDGYVLTNHHVVTKNRGYAIYQGKVVRFVVAGRLPEKDLAVVRLVDRIGTCPVIPLGQSHDVLMGETVAVMGNPGGRGIVVTSGVVSAEKMFLDAGNALVMTQFPSTVRDTFVQYDAASNRGNSGGPLLNMDGHLIGVVAALKPGEQNSGFAIPVERVRRMFDQILQVECVHQREIGMTLNRQADTAIATNVVPDLPAAKAGVQAGDILLKIGGKPIRHAVDWTIALDQQLPKGTPLDILVKRGATELPMTIQPQPTQPYESVSANDTEPGLKFEFFPGHYESLPDFSKLEAARSGVAEELDLEMVCGDSKKDHAIRLRGYLKIDDDGLYRLALKSDDGSRLRLHDEVLIDHDGFHPPMVASRLVRLKAGLHPLQIGFFQGSGGQSLSMTATKLESAVEIAEEGDAAVFMH